MRDEDRYSQPRTFRHLAGIGLLTVAALITGLLAVRMLGADDDAARSSPTAAPSSSVDAAPSTTLDPDPEVVARLQEILSIRDQAFRSRDAARLKDIYSTDCPCLKGDTAAIRELKANNYRLVGGETSIRVRRIEKASARLWLVIADFQSAPLRIESSEKKIIREEPGGTDLFQFAMSKPLNSSEWLLGRATNYQER
jgi:hypothetical protein